MVPKASSVANARSRSSSRDRRSAAWDHDGRVGTLVGDPADRLERDGASGLLHETRSSRSRRAPRAQSAPDIRARPAGATSSRRDRALARGDRGRRVRSDPECSDRRRPDPWLTHLRSEHLERCSTEGRRRPGSGREGPNTSHDRHRPGLANRWCAPRGRAWARSWRRRGPARPAPTVPPSSARSDAMTSGAPSSASRCPRLPASSSPARIASSARQHGPGVETFVEQHHAHPRGLVTLEDRSLHGRCTAPPRQQREVQVHGSRAAAPPARRLRGSRRTPRRPSHRAQCSLDGLVRRRPARTPGASSTGRPSLPAASATARRA